jgi:hypothetical protein
MKKYNKIKLQKNINDNDTNISQVQNTDEVNININNYTEVIDNLKCFIKNKDGTYTIGGKPYKSLYGSRKDVWEGNAYQTTGKLIKQDFILGKNGKIISKTKSIQGFMVNNLLKDPKAKDIN